MGTDQRYPEALHHAIVGIAMLLIDTSTRALLGMGFSIDRWSLSMVSFDSNANSSWTFYLISVGDDYTIQYNINNEKAIQMCWRLYYSNLTVCVMANTDRGLVSSK